MKKSLITIAVLATFPPCASASEVINTDIEIKDTKFGFVVQDGIEKSYTGSNISINVSDRGMSVSKNNKLSVGTLNTTNLIDIKSKSLGIAAFGGAGADGAKVDLAANTIRIQATSETGEVHGIIVQNNTTPETITSPNQATVNITSSNGTYIDAYSGNSEAKFNQATAITVFSQGIANIEGDLFINTQGGNGNAIQTRGGSEININASGKHRVVINGDIAFGYALNSQTPVNADVNITLVGKDSSWTGNSTVIWSSKPGPDKIEVEKNIVLSLKDGAVWTPTHTANDSYETENAGTQYTNLSQLRLSDGVVKITGNDIDVKIDKFEGKGTVNLATNLEESDGKQTGKFTVLSAQDNSSLAVNLMDTSMSRKLTSDEISPEQAISLKQNVNGKDVSVSTDVPEGMVLPGYGVDDSNKAHHNSANTLMQSSLELASAAPLALNRIMMNDVRKRLGDIRTTEGTHGVWARYDGGKLSGEGGLENDFHTVQVGIDTVPTADSARMGVAFSYTDSDAEYARGSADMKAYSIAMYGTKVFDNGMFVDVIGRMGTADSDLTVDGQHKGTLDNVVLGVSGEIGWRFDVTNSMYIEPQAELSYAYVNADKLTLGTAEYDVDSVNSLLGRVGFAAGLKCPSDFGNVYVRASAVHEFLGDSKITGMNAGNTNVYEIDGKDTWFEYGIGANFNITKSTYMWADVERTTGGALDEDWRATVGVRYAF